MQKADYKSRQNLKHNYLIMHLNKIVSTNNIIPLQQKSHCNHHCHKQLQ